MKEFQLYTPRTYLREFRLADAEGFYKLNNDPLVIRYTGDQAFTNIAEAKEFIAAYDHYTRYGFGRWAVVLRENNSFAGFCGLKYHSRTEEVDLGFRLNRAVWNKGLATEAAYACLHYGFVKLELASIIGRVRQKNKASIRVLEKLGMRRTTSFDFEGYPAYRYELTAGEYLRQRQDL